MGDKILKIAMIVIAGATILFLAYAIPSSIERDNRAEAIAKDMGCEYIGSARDLASIKFLDCNGEIKIIRVKRK